MATTKHHNSPGDPEISIDEDSFLRRLAEFAKTRGIVNQAGWRSFLEARFNAVNAAGLSAGTRQFFIEVFDKAVKFE